VRTQLERIAEKSWRETNFQFTSLAHHLTPELIWNNLKCIPSKSGTGIDGRTVTEAKETFDQWIEGAISSIHRKGYKAPAVRRVYIPKPGKKEMRPIGVPTVMDRAIQRSVAEVLSCIYEQDFLDCSFGGRPNLGAHKALCTFNELVAGKKVSYVYECDLKNFFGSLNHGWLERFVELRVGDPRILKLIKGWLKAGVMEDGERKESTIGTPQGGSISVLLSNIYLHYVLDLWFAKVVKPRLRGEAYLVRYLDDFVVCFQYKEDAIKFEKVLPKRLAKFSLELELTKTRLVDFGRFSQKWAKEKGERLETVYFLGFTHYCCRNRKGNFQVGRKTEKTRLKRFVTKLQEVMYIIRHKPLSQQRIEINQMLRGFYAYYGMGGNLTTLLRINRLAERIWRRALSSRSQRGNITWEKFNSIKILHPLQRPRLYVPYSLMKSLAVL